MIAHIVCLLIINKNSKIRQKRQTATNTAQQSQNMPILHTEDLQMPISRSADDDKGPAAEFIWPFGKQCRQLIPSQISVIGSRKGQKEQYQASQYSRGIHQRGIHQRGTITTDRGRSGGKEIV